MSRSPARDPHPARGRLRVLLAVAAWSCFAMGVAGLEMRLEAEERRVEAESLEAARWAIDARRGWQRWMGDSAPASDLWPTLPVDPQAGQALVRFLLRQPREDTRRVLPRVATLPLLVERWYHGVPPLSMLDGELALVAYAPLPLNALGRTLGPFTVARGVALDPALTAEVARRCPGGCPPLTGDDPARLRERLIALLDDPDEQTWLAALAQLSRGDERSVPSLEARVARLEPPYGRTLAFLALLRVSLPAERRAKLEAALAGQDPTLRLLAVLEAARSGDAGLASAVRAAGVTGRPTGIGVVAEHMAGLLEAAR